MLNQDSYGRLDNLPEPGKGGAVHVTCVKCFGKFDIEKRHKELHLNTMYFGRTKANTVTPAKPTDIEYVRLCETCCTKLKLWLGI